MAQQSKKYRATPRFIALIALLCIGFVCTVYFTQEAKLDEVHARQAELEAEYASLQAEEQRLEYMIEYAKSEEYRIQYAREKLGYVLPNDIKFNIENND